MLLVSIKKSHLFKKKSRETLTYKMFENNDKKIAENIYKSTSMKKLPVQREVNFF